MKDIVLATINAKWIHPSLALRLLKANLGELEDRCEIIEFALRQPLQEKIDALSSVQSRILGISVSIWNHTATIELLKELKKLSLLPATCYLLPIIVLGGPEVSHLPQDAEIFKYADYVIRGEGEIAFRELCEKIIAGDKPNIGFTTPKFIDAETVDVSQIKSAYYLYTDEDVKRKLIYVESSRGCPFGCQFCLSAANRQKVREFPLEQFLAEMNTLIQRGVKTFKFLDRTFNANIKRAIQICEFFLDKLTERQAADLPLFTVHFEMVPVLITPELVKVLARFPSIPTECKGSLRLEIGIQTLNPEVAERIGLPARSERSCGGSGSKTPEQVLEPLRILREKTNAIIHADLIAGLPGEDLESFGKGFDALWEVLSDGKPSANGFEVQLGILKQLPGTPIARHAKAAESGVKIISSRTTTEGSPNDNFKMHYNSEPPYEVLETSGMSAEEIARLKNFARFWELLINRRPAAGAELAVSGTVADAAQKSDATGSVLNNEATPNIAAIIASINFTRFMALSDALFARFGRNWGIDKQELEAAFLENWKEIQYI